MKLFSAYTNVDFSHVKNQFLAVACANLLSISYGGLMGWLSPSLLVLFSSESPMITGPITTDEASWLGSIAYLGGFFGTFVFLIVIKFFGRKVAFLILAIPNIIFWITVLCANRLEYLYAGRVLGGLAGGGTYIAIPLFVTEIADDKIRGILGSMLMIFACLGVMVSYVTGAYMSYSTSPYVMIVFPIGLFFSFLFLPDTPMSLMSRNKTEAAEKSLRFYKSCCDTSVKENNERFAKELEKLHMLVKTNKEKGEKLAWSDFTTREARVGFGKGVSMVLLSIFCGNPVLLNYASILFRNSGSNLDPALSAVIMIVIQLISTTVSTTLVDKVGRRILLIISSFGTAIGLTAMGTYTFLSFSGADLEGFDWVPVTSLSFAVLLSYVGLIPLVFVVLMEVLPPKIRPVAATFCLSFISLLMFAIVKFYPIVAELVQIHSCMWFFAFVSFLGVFFGIFVLEETKGKNVNV